MKMSKKFDGLNDAFDVESQIVPSDPVTKIEKVRETASDIKKDYDYTRGNLYSLIEKGQEAVNGALELAEEGDSARSYEVALNGIKNVSEIAEKLIDLQKKVKELDEVSIQNNQTNVTNNSVFVGSTSELQKMIKEGMLNNKLPEA